MDIERFKDPSSLAEFSAHFAILSLEERMKFLVKEFADYLVITSSFGLQSAVLLHCIQDLKLKIPVVWIDTGYLFPETYLYAKDLQNLLNLDLRIYQPLLSPARQEALYGKLWEQGSEELEKYALINRVEPMNRALKDLGKQVWISGMRKAHSKSRTTRSFAEIQGKTLKIYPILDWSDNQIENYLKKYHLPFHPLQGSGYVNLGDWHSTKKLSEVEDREKTRFNGQKYECGLHLESGQADFQI